MRLIPLVAIVNHSTVLTDAEVKNALPAFQAAVHFDYRPHWNESANLVFYPAGSKIPSDAWIINILDDSDQAGALGYHDLITSTGMPVANVFAKTDIQYGASWTVTLTHELFEMLADPYICLCAQTSDTTCYAYEVGDPVEDDSFAYTRPGADGSPIKISDFVYPTWFQPGLPGPYDRQHFCIAPLQVKNGGYVSMLKASAGKLVWSQFQAQHEQLVQVPLEADNPRFRKRG